MIYEPAMSSNERGETLLRRPFVWEDVVVRPLVGLSLLALGALVLYVFVTGGAPHPASDGFRRILGWVLVTGIFFLFGVVPAVLGLAALLRNEEIVLNSVAGVVEHRTRFGGITIFRRRFLFTQFDEMVVEHFRSGFPASRSKYAVIGSGYRRLTIGLFYDASSARELGDQLAGLMRLQLRPTGESAGGPTVAQPNAAADRAGVAVPVI